MIGVMLFVVAVLIIAIWVVIEIKRLKHKLFAIFLIGLILFGYLSTVIVFRGHEIDFKTIPGMMEASNLYVAWVGSIFVNMKTLTANAIKLDWSPKGNETG